MQIVIEMVDRNMIENMIDELFKMYIVFENPKDLDPEINDIVMFIQRQEMRNDL